ncbi:MAG: hypothetical protein NFCOHLIN_01265 [Gammaproteobacteria bacterium]|nr:hypothetical protein [Gammaproteobacteria bacterium]
MHLPIPLPSDADETSPGALRLPMLPLRGMRLIRRLLPITADGDIRKVIDAAHRPDRHVADALQCLPEHG